MEFIRISPHSDLEGFIECYWMMYSEDPAPPIDGKSVDYIFLREE